VGGGGGGDQRLKTVGIKIEGYNKRQSQTGILKGKKLKHEKKGSGHIFLSLQVLRYVLWESK